LPLVSYTQIDLKNWKVGAYLSLRGNEKLAIPQGIEVVPLIPDSNNKMAIQIIRGFQEFSSTVRTGDEAS